MIKPLRGSERRHVHHGDHEVWHSLDAKVLAGAPESCFGLLLAFDELRIQPGATSQPNLTDETEIVTYVYQGALSQEDTVGNARVMHTGEFQRMSTGQRIRDKETSVSRTNSAQLFRICLRPAQAGLLRDHEQRRFTEAQRRNRLSVVVSPDGRGGSLQIHQDALVCSAVLDPGHHVVHELAEGRTAWLHAVSGEVTLGDIVLTQGDSIRVTHERSISLTVQERTELLMVDLGPANRPPWETVLSEGAAVATRGGI
jgi:redox-sensitive bicupin YhaK (pirin superfamily)